MTVFLPGIEDDARFAGSCKALGGKVPQNTYRMELVSAIAGELMGAESATALSALESALDRARRRGYCVFDRGIHDDVPDPGLVYLCSTYPAAVRLKDSLDFVRAQGNEPDRHALGTYRMVDGYCIMGGLDEVPLADAYAVDAALIEDWVSAMPSSASPTSRRRRFRMPSTPTAGRRRRRSSTTPMRARPGPLPADRRRLAPGERQLPRRELDRRRLGARLYRRSLAGIPRFANRRHGGDGRGLRLGEAGEDPGLHAAGARKAAASSAAEESSPARSPTLPARSRRLRARH
ncbi:MAG: hypothetical protein ACLT98_00115 [Eggerthellaceae bacterium]